MCDPATLGVALGASASSAAAVGTLAYGAAGLTALQVYQGEQARKAQANAADQAAAQADQANNRANPKKPDVGAMLAGNQMAAKAGGGSTMLTGPSGVDPNTLTLGKSTLLGG